jgi:hypothetical protein
MVLLKMMSTLKLIRVVVQLRKKLIPKPKKKLKMEILQLKKRRKMR